MWPQRWLPQTEQLKSDPTQTIFHIMSLAFNITPCYSNQGVAWCVCLLMGSLIFISSELTWVTDRMSIHTHHKEKSVGCSNIITWLLPAFKEMHRLLSPFFPSFLVGILSFLSLDFLFSFPSFFSATNYLSSLKCCFADSRKLVFIYMDSNIFLVIKLHWIATDIFVCSMNL